MPLWCAGNIASDCRAKNKRCLPEVRVTGDLASYIKFAVGLKVTEWLRFGRSPHLPFSDNQYLSTMQ